jgi:DNA repair ATPase RecN
MSEKADLERKAIEALRHYREALARAEQLEEEEAAAREEVCKQLARFEISNSQDDAPRCSPHAIAAGQAAISRLSEVRTALSEATVSLSSAYRILAALDEKLGYIPGVEKGKQDPLETGAGESSDVA